MIDTDDLEQVRERLEEIADGAPYDIATSADLAKVLLELLPAPVSTVMVDLRQTEILMLPKDTRTRLLEEAAEAWEESQEEQKKAP